MINAIGTFGALLDMMRQEIGCLRAIIAVILREVHVS